MTKKNGMSKNIEGAQRIVLEILKTGEFPVDSVKGQLRNRGYSETVAFEAVHRLYEDGYLESGSKGATWVCLAGSVG